MRVITLLLAVAAMAVGTLLLMVISDLINPHTVEVMITPDMIVFPEQPGGVATITPQRWGDWDETAAAINIHPDSLTVDEFIAHDSLGTRDEHYAHMVGQSNERYIK